MRFRVAAAKSIVILTTLAMIAAGQVVPSPAVAAEASRTFSPFGINSHPMWGSRTDVTAELNAMAAAGARWLRFDIGWDYFEPTKGSYSSGALANLDYVVAEAQRQGIEPQVTVMATPSWANGGAGKWTPPTNDADFADFMRYIASRYRGRITYWEIWNEPNLAEFWSPSPDAARFTRLLKAAYVATKEGNPDAIVISGGLSSNDKGFLQQMYDAGAKGYFDLLGLHPYSGNRGPYEQYASHMWQWNFGGIADMKAAMETNGDNSKHIWISEVGWSTANTASSVTETQQAQYVTDAYKRLLEEFPYVDALIIYNLRNKGTDPANWDQNLGLLRKDFTPKPAYSAFGDAARAWQAPVALSASPTVVSYGQASTISVRLASPAETSVTIQRSIAGTDTWGDVTSTVTTADGTAQISLVPTATASYRAVIPDRGLTSAPVTIKVRARATVRVSRRSIRRMRAVRITGSIVVAPQVTMVLQRKSGRRWINVRRTTTTTTGRYSTTIRHSRRGRYYYRTRFYGNSSHLGTASRPVLVKVY